MFRKQVHETESLSAYLDGQVSAAERSRIERHLAECRECAAELQQLQRVVSLVRACPPVRPPRSFVLSPEQVAVRAPRPLFVRLSPYATAVAALLLVLVVFADVAVLGPSRLRSANHASAPAEALRTGSADVSTRGADEVREAEPTGMALMLAPAAQPEGAPTPTAAPVLAQKSGGQVPPTVAAGQGLYQSVAPEATVTVAESVAEAAAEPAGERLAQAPEASPAALAYDGSAAATTAPAAPPSEAIAPTEEEADTTAEDEHGSAVSPSPDEVPAPVRAAPAAAWWLWPLRAVEAVLALTVVAAAAIWMRQSLLR
ncbi:MAG: anti-sigma factor family protein [Anaerolineae bacterium]